MKSNGVILVVDDEPGIRDLLAYELGLDGYTVLRAESGEAAVEVARQSKVEAVITDLKMPGMGGAATTAALKALDPAIEVIVATGYATVESAVECMKAGAYDYIQKPFVVDELRHRLARALERRRFRETVTRYEDRIRSLESERKEAVESEKRALAVHLAADLAHEINNPLTVVRQNLTRLKEILDQLPVQEGDEGGGLRGRAGESVADVIEAVERIRKLAEVFRKLAGADAAGSPQPGAPGGLTYMVREAGKSGRIS